MCGFLVCIIPLHKKETKTKTKIQKMDMQKKKKLKLKNPADMDGGAPSRRLSLLQSGAGRRLPLYFPLRRHTQNAHRSHKRQNILALVHHPPGTHKLLPLPDGSGSAEYPVDGTEKAISLPFPTVGCCRWRQPPAPQHPYLGLLR